MNQVAAQSMRDGRERSHAAWCDDHPERGKRTAGNRSSLIADRITLCGHALHIFDAVLSFMHERALAPFAHYQMRLNS